MIRVFAIGLGLVGCWLVLGACQKHKEDATASDDSASKSAGQLAEGSNRPSGLTPKLPTFVELSEQEPNDKLAQANEIKASSRITATLEAASSAQTRALDSYRLALEGPRRVTIAVSGIEGEDLRIVAFDGDKNELFIVDASGVGEGERVPLWAISGQGLFQVQGSKGGRGGAYILSVEGNELRDDEEREPNDRYSQATSLALGKAINGFYAHPTDEDWYSLSVADFPAGSILRIDLSGVEKVRPQLVLAEPQERAPFLDVKGSEAGEGINVRNAGLPKDATSIYLVVKSAWMGAAKKAVRGFNPDRSYTLTVSAEAGGEDLEREPNDDRAHATLLIPGQPMRAYLAPASDVDVFKLHVDQPSLVAVELAALNRVDLQLALFEAGGGLDRKEEKLRLNEGKVNEPETLVNWALSPGDWYFKVEEVYRNIDGKWVKDVANLEETYSLKVELRPDDGLEEREPNDKPETATSVPVGKPISGHLHPRKDVDFYRLDLSEAEGPRTTRIELSGIPKLDVGFKLLSAGPEPKELANVNGARAEAAENFEKELLPGVYLIVVSGTPGSESNARDAYQLSVTQP